MFNRFTSVALLPLSYEGIRLSLKVLNYNYMP